MRVYASARNRILDAAESVLLKKGSALSVEAVAEEAKVSKGGFFHHFATRDELLAAVLGRLAAGVEERLDAQKGSRLLAQVELALDMPKKQRQRLRALVLALVTATLSGNRAVAAGARAANQKTLRKGVADGLPLGRALVAQLALDGYWLAQSLGTMRFDRKQKAAFRRALLELARKR